MLFGRMTACHAGGREARGAGKPCTTCTQIEGLLGIEMIGVHGYVVDFTLLT